MRNSLICFPTFFSGYDFGYMLKVLTDCPLPEEEEEFFAMIKLYFHNIYDVKYLMKSCKNLKGGLQEVAEQLEVNILHHTADLTNKFSLLPIFSLLHIFLKMFIRPVEFLPDGQGKFSDH